MTKLHRPRQNFFNDPTACIFQISQLECTLFDHLQAPAPEPRQQEMMKMTALQSQALQYQKLMQQQYQQYNKEMIKYQTQYQQWQDKQKTEESTTSLVCLYIHTPQQN